MKKGGAKPQIVGSLSDCTEGFGKAVGKAVCGHSRHRWPGNLLARDGQARLSAECLSVSVRYSAVVWTRC